MSAPTTAPPTPVQRSFLCWIAAVVIGVIGAVVSLVAGMDVPAAPGASTPTTVTGIVFGLVFLGVFAFLAVKLRQGHQWARLTLTILGVISVGFALIGLIAAGPLGVAVGAVSLIVNVVQIVLIVAAIVLSYQGAANGWFR